MRIGILGGTFDPIHLGHLALAEAAKKIFRLDKVLFVPAFCPPHKSSRNYLTEASHRYEMVRLAVEGHPDFEVCDIEMKRRNVSYTIETLRQLKKNHPHDEFFLIMGEDTFAGISGWHESQDIQSLACFLVAPRQAGGLQENSQSKVSWIPMEQCAISSSMLRERMNKKQSVAEFLPVKVYDYIERMNLYKDNPACRFC